MYCFFFFNDTATTEIYTLSLHDALPIWRSRFRSFLVGGSDSTACAVRRATPNGRSEEHTSELQSRQYLVCRLLLEKKKIPRSRHAHREYEHHALPPPCSSCTRRQRLSYI